MRRSDGKQRPASTDVLVGRFGPSIGREKGSAAIVIRAQCAHPRQAIGSEGG
jgi:hypothetical protein